MMQLLKVKSFKPCYKWNTFNTYLIQGHPGAVVKVLNLVISGIPSILINIKVILFYLYTVLNLVISGIPSILYKCLFSYNTLIMF